MFPIWKTFDRLYAKIAEDKGRVDVVFANAGIGNQRAPLGSITEEQIDRTFNVKSYSPCGRKYMVRRATARG
jgi:NAD(P)-dependent dehydrogenase (short-subunit alcohol dehydrogenase family)